MENAKITEQRYEANLTNTQAGKALAETIREADMNNSQKTADRVENARQANQSNTTEYAKIAASNAPAKATPAQEAEGWIQRNAGPYGKFRTPNDAYWQVIRNLQAGTVDSATGNAILSQLKTANPGAINTKEPKPVGKSSSSTPFG